MVPPTAPDSVLVSWIFGSGRFNQGRNFNNPDLVEIIWNHRCDTQLTYNLEALYGFQHNVPGVDFVNWIGVVNYLTYTVTPRVNGTVRLEFFDDFQGQRTGYPGLYSALTVGLAFRPIKDIIVTPEVRYDYNNDSRPFENNHGVFTADFDVILRW